MLPHHLINIIMRVRIYQPTIEGDTSIESTLTINFGTSTRSLNKQLGTLLSEIFERMDFYKSMGSRLCTCNAPLLVTFSTKNQTIDLGSIDEELVHKLKPSYNVKGRIRYAQRIVRSAKWMLETPDRLNNTITADELIAGLEAQLQD